MNRKTIRQLYKKEMLDVLRDKKTVIMMLVVPLLVYPLIFVVSLLMMTKTSTQMDTQTYRVGVDYAETDEELLKLLSDPGDESYSFELFDYTSDSVDTETMLRTESADAFLFVDEGTDGRTVYRIQYLSSVTNSDYAEQKLTGILEIYKEQLTRNLLTDAGFSADAVLEPIEVETTDRASTEESTGSLLGTIVPFMLVVSLLMGTMYPAIDTTAGERERGTLETILTLPVTNRELIFSKFLTVGTIGVISAMLNMLSMGGIGVYVYKLYESYLRVDGADIRLSRFIPVVLVCCLCVIAFAVLISALSMCFCVFAKTYKEANNYITPLMLIVMFASFIGFLPNAELTGGMTLVPAANICLLIRDLLAFKFSASAIAIVLFSNIAYGVFAVLLLGRLYNSEAILFGDGAGVRIFERRSNLQKGGVPSAGEAWLVIPVILVLIIYAGGYVSVKNVIAGLLVTQGMIAGVPLLTAWYTKRDMRQTFRLRLCRPGFFVGGALLIAGTLLLGVILSTGMSMLFPDSAASMTDSMTEVYAVGYGGSLLLVALLPAFCEELLFRGFLFSAMEARMKTWIAIVMTSLLFGLYHMNLVQSPTAALLGAALCFAAARSGSLFPGVLMHFLNNALSVTTVFYPDAVSHVLPFLNDGEAPAWIVALAGIMLCAIGVCVIEYTRKRTKNDRTAVEENEKA